MSGNRGGKEKYEGIDDVDAKQNICLETVTFRTTGNSIQIGE